MSPIAFLIILGVLATIAAMIGGGISMARGGTYDEQHGFQWMEARVIFQAITLLLLLIAALTW